MNQITFDGFGISEFGDELDFWESPRSAAEAILPYLPRRDVPWCVLEPTAGRGALVEVVLEKLAPRFVGAVELEPGRYRESASRFAERAHVVHSDFLTLNIEATFPELTSPRLVFGNPPYSLATECVERALEWARPDGCVAMLLQHDFATGVDRAERIHDRFESSLFPLRRRPSFGGGSTGKRPFSWFVWDLLEPKRLWRVL